MNRSTTIAATLALTLSLAVHGAVLTRISPSQGGTATQPGGAAFSMRGDSFEDLSTGSLAAVEPTNETVEPVRPDVIEAAMPAAAPTPSTRPSGSTPDTASAIGVAATVSARPAHSATVLPAAPAPLAERVSGRAAPTAQRPESGTFRPQTRPPPPEPRAAPVAAPAPPAAPALQPEGTADRNATAGTAQGSDQGTATQRQGDSGAAPGPTAREIARYPQLVNRHLSRLRRPNSRFAGAAVIGFTIAPGGGLASIAVVRSSGDAGFDDLAMNHIRGAAPFPAPPAGAQTRFSVSVRGR